MTTQIRPLPAPPQPSDTPAEFNSKAFSFLGALPIFADEANALAISADKSASDSAASKTAAASSQTAAKTSETNAASSKTAAASSATAAKTSETNSASSATAASASQAAAKTSETNAAASATDAATSKTNAATSESNSASSKSAAATSASAAKTSETNAAASAAAAASSATAAQNSAALAGAAVAMSDTYATVPATYKSWMIVVTQPHLRVMTWNSALNKYERAPFHRPGVFFHSSAPQASVTHGIQVRSDVTYRTVDHPDLAELFGYKGATFILPEGRARVLRAADNGAGIDPTLLDGSLQSDAIRNITATVRSGIDWGMISGTGVVAGAFKNGAGFSNYSGSGIAGVPSSELIFDASLVTPTAGEVRVKSLVSTLYITR